MNFKLPVMADDSGLMVDAPWRVLQEYGCRQGMLVMTATMLLIMLNSYRH